MKKCFNKDYIINELLPYFVVGLVGGFIISILFNIIVLIWTP